MSTGAIIAIVIGALIVLALIMLLARKGRQRRLDSRRQQAGEIRREAQVHSARADQAEAEAQEQAARAKREEAEARETAAQAAERRREADEHHRRAAELDPDADSDDLEAERQRSREAGAVDSSGGSNGAVVADDPERERRFARDHDERADEHHERADELEADRTEQRR